MLNDFEKLIYNKHLIASRKNKNSPFNIRKDFSTLNESNIFYIKKLAMFFNKFKKINIDDFFNAPYFIYPEENYFDLKFYISPKAIKTYNLFIKNRELSLPDSPDTLKFTANSIKFISVFCKQNNLQLCKYLEYFAPNETLPAYISHLQNHQINFYSLFGLDGFKRNLFKRYETYKFILGDVIDNTDNLYQNFLMSKKLKVLVKEGFKKIA